MQYLFSLNGAGIKTHDDLDTALRQARQWKNIYPSMTVRVEEVQWSHSLGYVKTGSDIMVEFPMLVPGLTPRHDFDDPPYI